MSGISDATWGSNKEDGKSVTGYVLYFMVVPITWKHKAQKHCSLSSSESEYIAISELVKEVQFGRQILDDMGCEVVTPIPICVNNIGAIQMVRNNVCGSGTRHVNVHFHYVCELHDDIFVMVFRRSEDNEADMMTKNVTQKEFAKHSSKMVCKIPKILWEKS